MTTTYVKPVVLYGSADVAKALGVTRATVSNWLYRRDDWPLPTHTTPRGVLFWDDLAPWHEWAKR